MGIASLLPLLKPAMQEKSLSEFRGMRVGVDGNVWVHRGAFSCAFELACGQKTEAFIRYCCNLAQLLLSHGVRPFVCFDGKALNAKGDTALKRREGRQAATREMENHLESLREMEHTAAGRPHDAQLQYEIAALRQRIERCAQTAISVTQEMVERTMAALRAMGVEVLRAPYEADAQLAFLAHQRKVDAVLTEDSDLVAYGCPCVLLKLDRHAGTVQRLLWSDLEQATAGSGLSLKGFTETMFLELCVLLGCDYLESIKGFGLKTAIKLMIKLKDARRVVRHLQQTRPKNVRIPPGYTEGLRDALVTFKHQRVWSVAKKALVHLTEPLPEGFEGDVDATCGADMDPRTAEQWVYAGEPPTADDPFSRAAAAAAAERVPAAGAVGGFSRNPLDVRRASGAPSSHAPRAHRAQHVASATVNEAQEVMGLMQADDAVGKSPARHGKGKSPKRSPRRSPGSGSAGRPRGLGRHLEQFDAEEEIGEMVLAEEAERQARMLDPAYSQRPPAPPENWAEDEQERRSEPSGDGPPPTSDAEGGPAFDAAFGASPVRVVHGLVSPTSAGRHAHLEPPAGELAEALLNEASAAAPSSSSGGGHASVLRDALRQPTAASQGSSSQAASLGSDAGHGALRSRPRNPFGKAIPMGRAAAPSLPAGNGQIDALHPFGVLASRASGSPAAPPPAAEAAEADEGEALDAVDLADAAGGADEGMPVFARGVPSSGGRGVSSGRHVAAGLGTRERRSSPRVRAAASAVCDTGDTAGGSAAGAAHSHGALRGQPDAGGQGPSSKGGTARKPTPNTAKVAPRVAAKVGSKKRRAPPTAAERPAKRTSMDAGQSIKNFFGGKTAA